MSLSVALSIDRQIRDEPTVSKLYNGKPPPYIIRPNYFREISPEVTPVNFDVDGEINLFIFFCYFIKRTIVKYINHLVYFSAIVMFIFFIAYPLAISMLSIGTTELEEYWLGEYFSNYVMNEYPRKGQNYSNIFVKLMTWQQVNNATTEDKRKFLSIDKVKKFIGEPNEVKDNYLFYAVDEIGSHSDTTIIGYVLGLRLSGEVTMISFCENEQRKRELMKQ